MLTYRLAPEDLGEIRFAISPALEAVLSLRALRDPARFPLQLPWVRGVQPRRAELDGEGLGYLVNERMGRPHLLTPPCARGGGAPAPPGGAGRRGARLPDERPDGHPRLPPPAAVRAAHPVVHQ